MPKFKIKSLMAFCLLGLLIYTFRGSSGKPVEYILASVIVIIFWYLLGLQLALSNLRNILILTFVFGTIIFVFRVLVPIQSPVATMGMIEQYDLDPGKIGFLKASHEIALELHLDKKPTIHDRYFKMGNLLGTEDGLHYANKTEGLNLSKLPKASQWANNNLRGNNLDQDTEKIKSWFIKSMTYSLTPGSLNSPTPLDQFLFESKKGFCEHFAASLTTLLRLKGYQSRVAYGYAGGLWNPITKTLTYENSDAHAWVEAFDSTTNQYQLIDPTSWVFPEVSEGRTIEGEYSWILISILVFASLFSIFLIKSTSPVNRLILQVSKIEKKYNLESKGLTLSERINILNAKDSSSKETLKKSLKIYINMYDTVATITELETIRQKE